MNIDKYDNEKIYCRMLGHHLTFEYCRKTAQGSPCRKIFDCWYTKFDIQKFMAEHYTEDEIKNILAPSKPKMTSLIEMIQQARKSQEQE